MCQRLIYASLGTPSPLVSHPVHATGQELPGLRVTVDKVVHHRDANFPPETPHAFVYFLTISNLSQSTVRLLGRKWIIRSPDGTTEVIEGDGIVGQTPRLPPGEKFSYNSYHVIGADAQAHGSFHGVNELGAKVHVILPPFDMNPPRN